MPAFAPAPALSQGLPAVKGTFDGQGLILAAAFCVVAALHVHLALTRTIHWDEFHYLNQVHEFVRGDLSTPLQTLHVRAFSWLAQLDIIGVDQVLRARLVMLLAESVTCTAIVLIARRFTTLPNALLGALAYLSAGYVLLHGASFRTDPIATALAMSALAVLARSRLNGWTIALFALLLGMAVMVTIKLVLLLPAFAGIAWLRWSDAKFSRQSAVALGAAPLAALALAGAIYVLHGLDLAPLAEAEALVARSGTAMFALGAPHTGLVLLFCMATSLPFVLLLGVCAWRLAAANEHRSAERLALAGLVAPLASVLIYVNSYPYFYAFILAPVAAGLAAAMPWTTQRYGHGVVAAVLTVNAAAVWSISGESRLDAQREIQQAANAVFPEPTRYFDFAGMLTGHEKANVFMSRWGITLYQQGNTPSFSEAMHKAAVPLVLVADPPGSPRLAAIMSGTENGPAFLAEDRVALRNSYRPAWGPFHLAGTQLLAGERRTWRVRMPGSYTVEGALLVNGTPRRDGDVIELSRGEVLLQAGEDAEAGLIWGRNSQWPAAPPPQPPFWTPL